MSLSTKGNAGVGTTAEQSSRTSEFYLVGAGPGSFDYLTIAAYKILEQADIVLYDRLVGEDILNFAKKHAKLIYVGKNPGEQDKKQSVIYRNLIKYNQSGKKIIRLKGGDPMVFARGVEEWLFAKELGYEVSYIPGISSTTSVPGLFGIPLTARDVSSSFVVLTGKLKNGQLIDDFSKFSKIDTVVVLMGVKARARVAEELIKSGKAKDTPCAFIENGSKPEQRIIESTLSNVAEGKTEVSSPSIFIIGNVVRFHQQLFSLHNEIDKTEFFYSPDKATISEKSEIRLVTSI